MAGGGEMGALMRARDWRTTSLGDPSGWPQALRTAIRLMLNTGHPIYIFWGADGACLYNDAYRPSLGPERHPGSLGRPAREVWDEIWPIIGPQLDQVLSGRGATWDVNALIPMTRQGVREDVYWTYSYSPIDDESALGGIGGVLTICTETTEQVQGAKQIAESEARLRFFDRLAAETAALADADAVLATTTRLLGEHLDLSVCAYADMDEDEDGFTIRGDWAAPGSKSIVGHYRLADFGELAVQNLSAGLPLVVNDNLRELAPDEAATFQSIAIAATICMPLVKEGRLTALMAIHDRKPRLWTEAELGLLREVTARSWAHVERVAAVAALAEREERLRLAVDSAEVGFWDVDEVNGQLIWPARTKAMFGISAGVPVTMQDFYEGLHPDDREATTAAYAAAIDPAMRALYDVEYRTIGKEDDLVRWVAAKGRGVFDGDGADARCLRVAGTAVEITARKAAETALRDSEARFRLMADAVPAIVWVTNAEGRNEFFNKQWFEYTGAKPAPTSAAQVSDDHVHPEDAAATMAAFRQAQRTGGTFLVEHRIRSKDGDYRWFLVRGEPHRDPGTDQVIRWFGASVDIHDRLEAAAALHELNETLESRVEQRTTELEQAHEQLRQSQKLEAMGQLTGGVSHDFNNLLSPIIGSLDLLQRKAIGGEREQRLIDGALQSAERARVLVQRLLAFARRQPLQPRAIDLGALVSGMADLVASTSGPQIKLVVDVAEDLPAAVADANQVEMAILNLSVNARDAMGGGGTLRISAEARVVGAGHRAQLSPGCYVRLSVADTGVGMDEATVTKAIEPFFSTKGVGRGTGLGLSMVHGLALQLGGALTIESRPGLGTNVEIWLPTSDKAAPSAERAEDDVALPAAGTALLVDDEELVRASTADMLSDLGYDVVEAESAEEALRLVEHGLVLDVLVTDHLMPGMTGTELAREVRRCRPNARVLVISGYAEVEGIGPDLMRLVKPFRQADLAAKLGELDEASAG